MSQPFVESASVKRFRFTVSLPLDFHIFLWKCSWKSHRFPRTHMCKLNLTLTVIRCVTAYQVNRPILSKVNSTMKIITAIQMRYSESFLLFFFFQDDYIYYNIRQFISPLINAEAKRSSLLSSHLPIKFSKYSSRKVKSWWIPNRRWVISNNPPLFFMNLSRSLQSLFLLFAHLCKLIFVLVDQRRILCRKPKALPNFCSNCLNLFLTKIIWRKSSYS